MNTPRTDAEEKDPCDRVKDKWVESEFARTLEHELNHQQHYLEAAFTSYREIQAELISLTALLSETTAQRDQLRGECEEARKKMTSAINALVETSRQMEAMRLQFETAPGSCPICSGPVIDGQCEECGGYQHLPTINKNLRTQLATLTAENAALTREKKETETHLGYLAKFMNMEGMTWCYLISETIPHIQNLRAQLSAAVGAREEAENWIKKQQAALEPHHSTLCATTLRSFPTSRQ